MDDNVRDDDLELALLTAIFVAWYGTMLRSMHTLVVHYLRLGPVPLDDAAVRQQVLKARAAAVQVDAYTRRAIAQRIADGAALGLSPQQIAYGSATHNYAGIHGLFTDTWRGRAQTIANTELQRAQLEATLQRYHTLGRGLVTHVLAHDGDHDEPCAARNGREFPLSNAPQLLHPNCRLSLSPVVR